MPTAPHRRAQPSSCATFAFIVALSIFPAGSRTSGLLRTVSRYFAVADSHASKPFFQYSQSMSAPLRRQSETSNLGSGREIVVGLVELARRARDFAEALEEESRQLARADVSVGRLNRDVGAHAQHLIERHVGKDERANPVDGDVVRVVSGVRGSIERSIGDSAVGRPR